MPLQLRFQFGFYQVCASGMVCARFHTNTTYRFPTSVLYHLMQYELVMVVVVLPVCLSYQSLMNFFSHLQYYDVLFASVTLLQSCLFSFSLYSLNVYKLLIMILFTILNIGKPFHYECRLTGTLANSEDQDESSISSGSSLFTKVIEKV